MTIDPQQEDPPHPQKTQLNKTPQPLKDSACARVAALARRALAAGK